MSGGIPTEAQLRRIREGVIDRIDRRRRRLRRTAGGLAWGAVLVGAAGLIGPALVQHGGASSSAGGSRAAGSVPVRCHAEADPRSAVRVVAADPGGLPGSAVRACEQVGPSSAAARSASDGPAVCRDGKGRIDVLQGAAARCPPGSVRVVRGR